MHYAVAKQNIEIIETLLRNGAKINVLNQDGKTPIHLAVVERKIYALEALIENRAQLHILDNKCRSPIYLAIKYGYGDIVSLLLPHININNNHEKNGYTPLHSAIHHHKIHIAKFLLDCGANVNAVCARKKSTPLQYAICNMTPEAMYLLLENNADPNIADAEKWTPLHVAVHVKNGYATKVLLRNGAQTDFFDNEGQTPIHRAVISGSSKAIKHFANFNADLNVFNKHGETALYISVRQTSSKMLRALLICNADVNIKIGFNRFTALHLAVGLQSKKMIHLLVGNDADANAQDINGDTPLHIAARTAEPSLVQILLWSININPLILNNNSQTALMLCIDRDSASQIKHKEIEYQASLTEAVSDSIEYRQYRDYSDNKEISK